MTNRHTIGEVAEKTGVTTHTLRYYERIGLLAPVARSAGGRRAYDDGDVGWVQLLTLLRATGMGIRDMLAFAELTRAGEHTIPDRIEVLQRHRDVLDALLRRHTEHLQLIDNKLTYYRGVVDAAATEDAHA
ncbi:MerR family transcriptional regulator [Cellulomonas sp. NS3]|uniref:MerR family transcriptional regulator n=1 Tax=Cellulomonas sp. NS3 TaxID=2973977 RepID=UPI0021616013|nr:MerR family transcriptional regulator [Cellulomonas sp. NS3]